MRIFWNGDRGERQAPRLVHHPGGDDDLREVVGARGRVAQIECAGHSLGDRHQVPVDHLGRRAFGHQPAALEQQRAIAERRHRAHVVADEDDRAAVALRNLAHLAEALLLEVGVADRQHLVDDQDLRLQVRGDREGQPNVHAAAVALDRRVEEALDLGERDDLVELRCRSRASSCRGSNRSDRCSPGRSARGESRCRLRAARPTRPRNVTWPRVGSTMRDRIFSSVLLPAPLRPMMPITSPGWISNETSCSAQKSSIDTSLPRIWRNRRSGAVAMSVSRSRNVFEPAPPCSSR